jgi:hypothetical protein
VFLVQERKEAWSRGTSLQATKERRWAGGDPWHGCLQLGFPCLRQPLLRPCAIPMRVAQSWS